MDHVGSTAVAGLPAKPIVDILICLQDWAASAAFCDELTGRGYVRGIGDDRFGEQKFFTLDAEPGRNGVPVQLHMAAAASPYGRDMLAFRDVLLADAAVRADYARLKEELARRFGSDLDAYTRGKTSFVRSHVGADHGR